MKPYKGIGRGNTPESARARLYRSEFERQEAEGLARIHSRMGRKWKIS